LLANDPHLAASMPGIWYELELIAPGLQVAGASLPGVPLIMIGHNRDLAWGFTSTIADTQDVFIERLLADGQHVARPTANRNASRRGSRVSPSRVRIRSRRGSDRPAMA
jgi:acyl-homoserine lactone acylase PvdQ